MSAPEASTGTWHGITTSLVGAITYLANPETWIMLLTIAALALSCIVNLPKACQAIKTMRKKK